MRLFVGIEAVSQRNTIGAVADAKGTVLAGCRLPYGTAHHTVPRSDTRKLLLDVMRTLAGQLDITLDDFRESVICLGVTGVTFAYDAIVSLTREFDQHAIPHARLICTGDAEIVLASHTPGNVGSAIICHMGSTAYVCNGTMQWRFGGWGPVIGDEGSGYWMGVSALRAIGREFDRREPQSILWQEINNWLCEPVLAYAQLDEWQEASIYWRRRLNQFHRHGFGLDPRTAVFSFSYAVMRDGGLKLWRVVASSLVIPLMRAFERGDQQAAAIVDQAADLLATQHFEAIRVSEEDVTLGPIVLYGGAFLYNQSFCDIVRSALRRKYDRGLPPVVTARDPAVLRPVFGALLFALGGSTSERLELPTPEIRENLRGERSRYFREGPLRND